MRTAFVAVFILIAGAAAALAQPGRPYEIYILDPAGEGAETYAFVGPGRAAALQVRGCSDASLISDAAPVVEDLRARSRRRDQSIVRIEGRGSRVELSWCGQSDDDDADEEEAEEEADDLDTLVVVDGLNATQMRRVVRSIDAAPRGMREDVLTRLGL